MREMAQSAAEARQFLTTTGLGIRFGGHQAVNDVTCAFKVGTLTAIVGPNGAGKTTYFNLISGQLRATSGSIHLFGSDLSRLSASQRARRGIGRAFQLTNLFPRLSVEENIRLAVQSRSHLGGNFWSLWSDRTDLIEEAARIAEQARLSHRRSFPAAALSHGDQRKLEVAMLMALQPDVYMFDEPTAGMSVDEVPVILDLIRALKDASNKIILLVEHKMDVIRSLADRVVVLHNGTLVADGPPAEVVASAVVQEAYLGKGRRSGRSGVR
jgi:branched-chain amino acid transport system ATP-binding protein